MARGLPWQSAPRSETPITGEFRLCPRGGAEVSYRRVSHSRPFTELSQCRLQTFLEGRMVEGAIQECAGIQAGFDRPGQQLAKVVRAGTKQYGAFQGGGITGGI